MHQATSINSPPTLFLTAVANRSSQTLKASTSRRAVCFYSRILLTTPSVTRQSGRMELAQMVVNLKHPHADGVQGDDPIAQVAIRLDPRLELAIVVSTPCGYHTLGNS